MVSSATLTTLTPRTAAAAPCEAQLLTFPAWYRGLVKADCSIKNISDNGGADTVTVQGFATRVVLNITEMILQLVGYASVVMIIIGGFRYIVSTGESSNMASAKKTIQNSIIGLIISLFSVAIVRLVYGALVS
jgi:hypothetical protein